MCALPTFRNWHALTFFRWEKRKEKMMEEKVIFYKLDAFEGPLDLLLHLIEKNKKYDIIGIDEIQFFDNFSKFVDFLLK